MPQGLQPHVGPFALTDDGPSERPREHTSADVLAITTQRAPPTPHRGMPSPHTPTPRADTDSVSNSRPSSSRHHPSSSPRSPPTSEIKPPDRRLPPSSDCLDVIMSHPVLRSGRLAEYLTFALILLLIALPSKPFLVFAVFYSCTSVILPALSRQPPAPPKQAPSYAPRLTNLFWSSLVVLILPHCLRGLSFVLHAWSCCVYDLGDRIPVQSAATAFAIECILLSLPYLKQLYVLPPKVK